ncbi:MAG: hypothetical protein EOP06_08630, partial [Proteobacteria bacterium]
MTIKEILVSGMAILSMSTVIAQTERLTIPAEWTPQKGIFVNYSGNEEDFAITEKVHQSCRSIIRELSA